MDPDFGSAVCVAASGWWSLRNAPCQTVCGGVASGQGEQMSFALRTIGPAVVVCAALVCDDAFAQNHATFQQDPVRAQLLEMGQPGLTISLARERVIEILESENSCSAWFQKVDPDAAATFASLKFIIDANGPQYIVGWRSDSGEMLFKQPYSAKARENTGRNSVVILNANGPFFTRTTSVLQKEISGSSPHPAGWRLLQVGSYAGNTLAAQMTTLLHELGHVVGRIPDDSDELRGQSGRNTAEVLHFCRAQIRGAERRSRHSGS